VSRMSDLHIDIQQHLASEIEDNFGWSGEVRDLAHCVYQIGAYLNVPTGEVLQVLNDMINEAMKEMEDE
jgi:hypothetical protein